ncbi:CPBP family intramembrane glutamic endopeptidase [Paramaledivibacter caminithermalis]|nr:type II CAAX endopeptidase family protein [Paramaledivibacter caminithermalis]
MGKENSVLSKENRIFSLTKESRYLPNAFLAIIIIIIVLFGIDLVLFLTPLGNIGRNISVEGLKGEALFFSINGLGVRFGMYILTFFAWVKFIEKRPLYTMGFGKDSFFKKYFRGFILGFLMMGFCVIAFTVMGLVRIDVSNPSIKGFNALGSVFIVLMGWMIQGASEEIMIRGWLLPVIGSRHNVALGIFISSTLFGAMHLLNANINILPMLNLILFGLFAALYVIWEGGIWGICGLHSAWNWTQGNVFGIEVSGNLPAGGILIDLETAQGSELITGGLFGIEGGVVCSIVLALGIITLVFLIKRR